jgi:probable blue pigment (indigoidine) exporter
MSWNISSKEAIMSSMETKWLAAAALAPIAWGSGYYVTATYLPADRPLFGAAVRALPFGLLLLALRPARLRGTWWWRTALLGALNFSAFFTLIFVAADRLPGGLAATLTATSPLMIMLFAWALAGERPPPASLAGAFVGLVGVALLVLRGATHVDAIGVLASLVAVTVSSLGFILVKTWRPPVDLLPFTAWQLIFGGLLLVPIALIVEGAPPPLDGRALGGFAWLGLAGTVLAYVVWFQGMRRLPAAAVSLVGLLNPVSGTVIGVALAGEAFTPGRGIGMALVLGGIVLGQPAVVGLFRRRDRAADTVAGSAEREEFPAGRLQRGPDRPGVLDGSR